MKAQSGFTLLELMVAIFIAAIVLGYGVPSFTNLMQNGRMTSGANDMLAACHIARTEAVKRRTNVTMCPSANPLANPPVCGGAMTAGWVVFVDRNGDTIVDPNALPALDDTVLQTHDALPANWNVAADGTYLQFAPTGFVRTAPIGPPVSTVVMCDDRGNANIGGGTSAGRVLTIGVTGRPQILRTVVDVAAAGGCP